MTINSPVGWLTSWAESWWSAAAGYLKAISTPLFSVRFFPITSLTQSSSPLTPIYYNLRSFGQAGYFEASIVSTIVERLVKDKGKAHKVKRGAMPANLMCCPFASSLPSPPVVEVFLRNSSWAAAPAAGDSPFVNHTTARAAPVSRRESTARHPVRRWRNPPQAVANYGYSGCIVENLQVSSTINYACQYNVIKLGIATGLLSEVVKAFPITSSNVPLGPFDSQSCATPYDLHKRVIAYGFLSANSISQQIDEY